MTRSTQTWTRYGASAEEMDAIRRAEEMIGQTYALANRRGTFYVASVADCRPTHRGDAVVIGELTVDPYGDGATVTYHRASHWTNDLGAKLDHATGSQAMGEEA